MGPSGRNVYENEGWVLRKLTHEEYKNLYWFDCNDEDINEFFQKDALDHKNELMAESYCFELKSSGTPAALLCLQNDSLNFHNIPRKEKNTFGKGIELPFVKRRYSSIPAVKIGRLGVQKEFQGHNIGSHLLETCKKFFVTDNRTGCRLITIDAYISKVDFYKRSGFRLFVGETVTGKDDGDTVIMYCNLKPYWNEINQK